MFYFLFVIYLRLSWWHCILILENIEMSIKEGKDCNKRSDCENIFFFCENMSLLSLDYPTRTRVFMPWGGMYLGVSLMDGVGLIVCSLEEVDTIWGVDRGPGTVVCAGGGEMHQGLATGRTFLQVGREVFCLRREQQVCIVEGWGAWFCHCEPHLCVARFQNWGGREKYCGCGRMILLVVHNPKRIIQGF